MTLHGIVINGKNIIRWLFYAVLLYFFFLMVLITFQYIPIRTDVAFLKMKQDELTEFYYPGSFFIHVYTGIFVLILGFLQFSNHIRAKYTKIHRTIGKLYIILVLFFAGPTGLIMGYHANGGFSAQLSFSLLAVLWMYFTYQAFRNIRRGEWQLHKNYMYRSYALTLSAISLRLFKWIIVSLYELPPMDTYIIVAWAGWLVNLLIAEIFILNSNRILGVKHR